MSLFAKVVGWFVKNPAVIALLVALAAVSIVAVGKANDARFFKKQSETRGKRVEALNRDIGTLNANVTALTSSISSQNQAIDALAKATLESDAKFAGEFVRLQQGRAATGAAVAELMKRVAPDDKCAGAYALVKEFAR